MWQTVTETPTFSKIADKFLDEVTKEELIEYIANNPTAGDIIQGTGGCRKLRWKRAGTGKSSGIRTIYYFYNEQNPIYLLLAYPKSVMDNITDETKNILKQSVSKLKGGML
ncbi:type II toxin-antitoxin system RelE/ParE family toxin [Francisella sciaenopsi]|uniref:Type II toxin-antitoxin system RelE/ParE family toxin n=1 Tax=Francisella sciaenopsi TaxID=3055034 RepID=A0ABQ6PCZ7_9GAMM